MATKSPRNESAARRRKVTKFALAGVAIVGVGAGLTSAAWSDNVWFGGAAASGAIELQGRVLAFDTDPSYVPGPFVDADDQGVAISIPVEAFGGLTPDDDLSVTLELYNDGDGILEFQTPVVTAEGTLFDAPGVESGMSAFSAPDVAPGESATIEFSIQTPDWDENEGQGLGGTIDINIQAQT